MQAAIQQYKAANALQSETNRYLSLQSQLATETAAKNKQSFRDALTNVNLKFENAELRDIRDNVQQIVTLMQNQNGQPAQIELEVVYLCWWPTNIPTQRY